MGRGPNRRTFVRGAAGAVGMGAVGAMSSKLGFAAVPEVASSANPTIIPVTIVPIGQGKPGAKNKLVCPDAEAEKNWDVEWQASTGVQAIRLVAFKGRSPFRGAGNKDIEVLEAPGTSTVPENLRAQVGGGSTELGTYSYTIVALGTDGKTYARDPELDIVG
jgi:hypothetical protein